jgi:predicted nucleotidyltransferase
MEGLGIVDFLSFGSESGEVEGLSEVAALFAENSGALNGAIREEMGKGVSYPAARERAVACLLGSGAAALMRAPNDILAIEYLRELIAAGSGIRPVAVKRAAAGVGETNAAAGVAGATALRAMFRARRGADVAGQGGPHENHAVMDIGANDGGGRDPFVFMPPAAARAIQGRLDSGGRLVFADDLFPHLVRTVIFAECGGPGAESGAPGRTGSGSPHGGPALSDILSATEGLENRLIKAVRRARCMDEVVRHTKTRRYTETRVRRLILHTVMGLTKEAMSVALTEPPYARVLAFSERGALLIRRAKREGGVPVITNANRERDALASSPVTFGYDLRAAELHRLLERGDLAGFRELSARPSRHPD